MHSKEAAGCRLCRYRRVQEKRQDRDCLNGEVTVYLTLTFVLFVSLILALVESASVQMAKNYRRADMRGRINIWEMSLSGRTRKRKRMNLLRKRKSKMISLRIF